MTSLLVISTMEFHCHDVLGSFSDAGAMNCTPCPPGQACPNVASSVSNYLCIPGTFSEGSQQYCSSCPKGSYCPDTRYTMILCNRSCTSFSPLLGHAILKKYILVLSDTSNSFMVESLLCTDVQYCVLVQSLLELRIRTDCMNSTSEYCYI